MDFFFLFLPGSEALVATWVRAGILALRETGLEGHAGGAVREHHHGAERV